MYVCICDVYCEEIVYVYLRRLYEEIVYVCLFEEIMYASVCMYI